MEFAEQIRPALDSLLVAVAIALLGILTAAIGIFQRRAVAWLSALSADQRWKAAIGKLDEAAHGAVHAAEQTIAEDLRAAAPMPGFLTEEQASRVFAHAKRAALEHLGPAALQEIVDALGLHGREVDKVLETRIEAIVQRMKSAVPIEVKGER